MRKFVVLALLLMLLPCYAIAQDSDGVVKITDPEEAHQMFAKALKEKDIEQLCSMYSDDAVMVLKEGELTVEGKYRIRRVFRWMIESVTEFELETVYKVETDDTVLVRSKYKSKYVSSDGELEEVTSSGIEVLKKQPDGSWLFVIDHQNGASDFLVSN